MAIGVFVIFMILMPILLLNMLIAMMATTFERVIKKSEKDWIHEWAKITITLERTFTTDQLLEFQKVHSVEIDSKSYVIDVIMEGSFYLTVLMALRKIGGVNEVEQRSFCKIYCIQYHILTSKDYK